jgi:hypothetical protein
MEVREPVTPRAPKEAIVTNPDKVKDILRQAADVVAAAEVPQDLRAAAFDKAVDLLAGRSVPDGNSGQETGSPADADPDDLVQRIATKLGLDRRLVDETFEIEDGQVKLTVARPKLESAKTAGTKQIAVLLAAARQAAGIEEKTKAQTIREVADDYGKLDPPNFAATIGELGDYLSFSGGRMSREVKVKRAGYEEAAASIQRLQG